MSVSTAEHGSLAKRIVAYLIDSLVSTIAGLVVVRLALSGLLAAGLYSAAGLILPNITSVDVDATTLWESYSAVEKARVMVMFVALPRWLYMTLFHGSRLQATPGKLLLGLKLVDACGARLSYMASAVRSLSRGALYLCTLGLSELVSVVFIMTRQKREALLDLIVGSKVVLCHSPSRSGNTLA